MPRPMLVDALYTIGYAGIGASAWAWLGPWRVAAVAWLVLEVAAHVWGKWRFHHINQLNTAPTNRARMLVVWQRFFELRDVFGIEEFLQGWFLGAPAHTILRGNLEQFASYIFFNKRVEDLPAGDLQLAREFLAGVELAWGTRFAEGYNPHVSFMGWLWDPLRFYHKPLALYVATEAVGRLAHLGLWAMGFASAQQGRFRYWVRQPTSSGAQPGAFRAGGGAGAAAAEAVLSPGRAAAAAPTRQDSASGQLEPTRLTWGAGVGPVLQAAGRVACTAPMAGQQEQQPEPTAYQQQPGAHSGAGGPARVWGLENAEPNVPPGAMTRRRRLRHLNDSASSISLDCTPGPLAPEAWGSSRSSTSPGSSTSPLAAGVPIVFIHGVGFGMLPYLHFVREVAAACGSSPVIMVEVPHVSLRLCWEAAAVDDVAHAVAALLEKQGFAQACIIGHSYGTFCASRISQLYPQVVHSMCLLDPVCMLSFYPQLLFNFIYRAPTLAALKSPLGLVDVARFVACSRDLTIAQAFSRKFPWVELMLWPQDMPDRCLVVLAGQDDLVPAQYVLAQMKLKSHPAEVLHHPDLGHGGVLMNHDFRAGVVAGVRRLLEGAAK